jgi:hypothetical protein
MLLKIHDRETDDFVFHNENSFLGEYAQFIPPKLSLDTGMMELIGRRNVSAQVENAFYAVKKDSVLSNDGHFSFFFTPDKTYNLDDFTRFPTMDDIFREIIPEVIVRIRDGNSSLVMMNSTSGYRFANPPLVLVDGIPIADANVVMNYDPALIKTISLVTRHYFYGGLETDGIISIETYDGLAKHVSVTDMVRVNYIQSQSGKIYYAPQYDGEQALTRIPDFRTQLYWNPAIHLHPGATETLSFFTGDLSGNYFVEVVGVGSAGERIYWKQTFVVK